MNKTFFELTDCDDGTGGVGAWIPTEHFIDYILDGVVCYGQLSGKVTAFAYDMNAGEGNTVNVPYVSPRTHACSSTSCNQCLSETSTTFGDYPIHIWPQGDYDLVHNWGTWQANKGAMGKIMNEMAKRLAMCRDQQIWRNLSRGFTPNVDIETQTTCGDLTMTSCCTYQYDLYNSIVSAQKHLESDAYKPDYVVLNPDVAKWMYWRDGGGYSTSVMPGVKHDSNGQLTHIGTMKVIESCVATNCDSTSGSVLAVVFDSKRAVGEAWGKRPTFNKFYDAKCDNTELVLWTYWGSHIMDINAVAWVSNP